MMRGNSWARELTEYRHMTRNIGWSGLLMLPSRWLPGLVRARSMHLLAGAALLMATATVSFTVAVVFRLHVALPVWDEWAWVVDLQNIWHGTYDWAEIVRPHNEHRIAFPRLIFLADAWLFAMSGKSVLLAIFLLQAVNAVILIRLLSQLVAGAVIRLLLSSLVVMILFSLRQSDNFDNVFQVQFVGVFTAALIANVCYVRALVQRAAGERRADLSFFFAALACVVSTYSMANGVFAGLVLVVLAVMLRAAWWIIIATSILWCGLAAAFFYHYQTLGGPALPLSYAVHHAANYIAYFLAYLGNPISTMLVPAEAFGVLGLVGFATATWCVASRRSPAPASAALLGIAGFMVATACSTVYGRAPLGIHQALESRYVTPTSLFWCALVIFWASEAKRTVLHRGLLLGRALLVATIATLAVSSAYFETVSWPRISAQVAIFRQFRDSLLTGLFDAKVTARYENWPDEEIRGSADFLRDARLSLFAEPRAALLGRRIPDFGSITDPQSCRGGIAIAKEDADLGGNGTWLRGSAYDQEHGRGVRDIVVTDRDGIVVGYGSLDRPLGPPREWIGYARSTPGAELRAYADIGVSRFCLLGATTVALR